MRERAVTHLILGDGAAGMSAAQALRSLAPEDSVLLVSSDPRPFYYRAALTNYVLGRLAEHELDALPGAHVEALGLRRECDTLVELRPADHRARFERLGWLSYRTLLLATGASARRLTDLPGADLPGVCVLRTLADANEVIERAEKARHAVVLGGGILGLEAAQALRERGIDVTLVHRGAALFERVLDRTASDLVLQRARADGADVRLAAQAAAFEGTSRGVREVTLADGTRLPADLVLQSLGNVPNTAPWVEGTGIATRDGYLVVDREMRVEGAPDVFAAGDVASFEDRSLPFTNPGGLWQPAVRQGVVAGRNMAGGKAEYRPGAVSNATRAWDLDVVSIGTHVEEPGETVRWERRAADPPVYKRALLREGRVVGVLLLGDRREGTALQELMNLRGAAGDVRRIADDLFRPEFDLFAWVDAQRRAPGVARHDRAVDLVAGARPRGLTGVNRALTQRALGLAQGGGTAAYTSLPPPPLHLTLDGKPVPVVGERVEIGDRDAGFAVERQGMVWMALVRPRSPVPLLRNGRLVSGNAPLKDGDALAFGPHRLVVAVGERRVQATPLEPLPAPAFLLGSRSRHDLVPPTARVGRDRALEVVVEHASVAPHHADLVFDAGARAWTVSSAVAGAPVLVNGQAVSGARRLADRDTLTVGRMTLTFVEPPRGAAPPARPEAATGALRLPGWLVATRGPLAGQVLPLGPGVTIGRGEAAGLRLDDVLLSGAHARFDTGAGGVLTVEDLGSTNGTQVNGQRLAPGTPQALRDGDRLLAGRNELRFALHAPEGAVFDAASQGREHVAQPTRAVGRVAWWLEQPQEGGAPALHPLVDELVRVGRAPHCDLQLPHRDVSREHAELRAADRGYEVVDLGSKLGTKVNDRALEPGTPRALDDGDVVSFAGHAYAVRKAARTAEHEAAGGLRLRASLVPLVPRMDLGVLPLPGLGPWIVGRQAASCSVVVPLDTVSRTHCEIRRAGERFTVRNLSSNGTTRNGAPVPGTGDEPLEDGDVLVLQDVPLRFRLVREGAGSALPPPSDRFREGPALAARNPLEADLEGAVKRELAACIGCHECMRACPLEDAPKVTIGALNAYARDAAAADETVLRFVSDCTQCHRCVPVCPADIRRSRLVLWNKLRTVPEDGLRLTLQVGDEQAPSALTVGHVSKELARHEVLGRLPDPARKRLVAGARLRQLSDREVLFREGDFLDALWLVWEGTLSSEVAVGADRTPRPVVPYGPGQTAGEAALLGDQPADATVRARGRALVLGFSKYALTSAREQVGNEAFDESLEGLYLHRSRGALLERLGLTGEAARAFAAELRPQRHAPGETILLRIEAQDALGWVARGFVREMRRGLMAKRVANYLRAGDVFGGPGVEAPDDVLVAYEAATQADTFLLTRTQLEALDRRFPGLAARLLPTEGPARGAAERGATKDGVFVCPGGIGPLQAHQLLVIDTRLCVDCNNCVDACERRHGRPRLERENAGLQQGPFQVPASCYHCADPLCLFCSVNGIVREPSGEIRIVEANCIGCGQCAERCPYDNIFMAPRVPDQPGVFRRWVAQPIRRLFGRTGDRWRLEPEEQVAVKCDLCAGHSDGPACVRSCPTGAARRDEPAVLFGIGRGAPDA